MAINKYLVMMCMVILLIGLVNAWDLGFDNKINVSSDNKTITYIDTAIFGTDTTLAEITLNSEIHEKVGLGYQKVFEYTIRNDYEAVDKMIGDMNFYNVRNGMKPIEVDVDLKYKTINEIDVLDYDISNCKGELYCNGIVNGSHKELIEYWEDYTPKTILKDEVITISGWTNVKQGDNIEWEQKFYDDKLYITKDIWATWTGNLSVGLVGAFKLDEETGDAVNYIEGGKNLTENQRIFNETGKIKYARGDYKNTSAIFNQTSFMNFDQTVDWSVDFWVKRNADLTGTERKMILGGQGTSGYYYFLCLSSNNKMRCLINKIGGTLAFNSIDSNDMVINEWEYYSFTYDSATRNTTFYRNGVISNTSISSSQTYTLGSNFQIGAGEGSALPSINISFDDVGVWNRTLSYDEIQYRYNSGTGCSFGNESCFNTPLTITLNSPADASTTSNTNVVFNCTGQSSIDGTLANVSLIINSTYNVTNNSITNATPVINTVSLADGYYNWTCEACDSNGCDNATTRSFSIDATAPQVTALYPTGTIDYHAKNTNITLNFTASDTNIDSCWYELGGANYTLNCSTNSSFNVTNVTWDTLIVWANDTYGNINSSTLTWDYKVFLDAEDYNTTSYISKEENYTINVLSNGAETITANLIWNGTTYTGTKVGDNNAANFSKSLQMSAAGTNIPFYWSFTHGSDIINSTTHYLNVSDVDAVNITNTTCAAGWNLSRLFNFSTEAAQSALTAMDVDYNIRYGISNNSVLIESGNIPVATTIYVCINSTSSPTYIVGYGELQYEKSSYVDRRFYLFTNSTLTTTPVNTTIYDLNGSLATSFLFTIQESDLSNLENAYVTLNRWYPEDDEYKVVEMSKTDNKGQTIMKVEVEDVDYRVGVYYQNGTLIYLADPIRFACIESPCTYNLRIPDTAADDWENWNNLENTLVFNSTTGIFTFTYSDPSQETSEIRLEVFRETGTASLSICNDSSSSWAGVLTCNVSGYTGLLRAVAYRTASPEISINSLLEQITTDTLTGDVGLFITLTLVVLFSLIGIASPILAVFMSILAFIPAMVFGITPLAIMMVLVAMGMIVIHFMKRSVG